MTKQNTMIRDLTTGSVFKTLIYFALPLILANFLQTAYNLVDSVIVGRFVGPEGLAGVVATGELMNLFTLVGMGFGSAGQIIIAQQVGRGDLRGIQNTIGTMLTSLLAIALGVTVLFFVGTDWMLGLLKIPPESMEYARRYVFTCGMGMVFIYGYNAVSCVLRGMGDSQKPLVFVAIAAVANCIFDLVFIVGFGLDTLGAALATVLGQGVSFVVSLVYLYRRRESFGFDFRLRSFIPERKSFRLLMKIGLPQATQFAAVVISMLYVSSLINQFGVAAAAVNGVSYKLESVCRVVTSSMSTATAAVIAQSMGAGKLERCQKAVRCTFWVCSVYCALCALCIGLWPERVFGLFSSDEAVLAMARQYALVGVIICGGHALRNTFLPVLNGIGFASFSMVVGLLDGVIGRIGLSILLGIVLDMGLLGFWWGSCIAGYLSVFIVGPYYFSGRWKTYKLL